VLPAGVTGMKITLVWAESWEVKRKSEKRLNIRILRILSKEGNLKVFKNLKKLATGIVFVVILTAISLAGCSSDVSQNQSSSSGQQSSTSVDEQSVGQTTQPQQPSSSGQEPAGSPGQQSPDASNMTAILSRAAEILGIASDDFIAAFNNTMPEGGAFGSVQQGQPSAPPSDQQGQPPAPPSVQQGQPSTPPSGQQMPQSQFMTEVYEKMALELDISADDIAEAIIQAEEELRK